MLQCDAATFISAHMATSQIWDNAFIDGHKLSCQKQISLRYLHWMSIVSFVKKNLVTNNLRILIIIDKARTLAAYILQTQFMIIWLVTLTKLLRHCLANYNIININVTVFLFDCHSWSHSSWYFPGTHIVRFSFFPSLLFHHWTCNHTHYFSRRLYFWLCVRRGTVIFPIFTSQF